MCVCLQKCVKYFIFSNRKSYNILCEHLILDTNTIIKQILCSSQDIPPYGTPFSSNSLQSLPIIVSYVCIIALLFQQQQQQHTDSICIRSTTSTFQHDATHTRTQHMIQQICRRSAYACSPFALHSDARFVGGFSRLFVQLRLAASMSDMRNRTRRRHRGKCKRACFCARIYVAQHRCVCLRLHTIYVYAHSLWVVCRSSGVAHCILLGIFGIRFHPARSCSHTILNDATGKN